VGGELVRPAGTTPAPVGVTPPEPTYGFLARRGLPAALLDGVLPIGLFYAGQAAGGLLLGILLASGAAAAALVWEIRRGGPRLLAKLSLVFVVVQAAVGLIASSAVVYLAQPVLANLAWSVAFLVSALIGRPLAGTFAHAWYPFGEKTRRSAAYRRIFGVESVVWAAYLGARGILRLAALLRGGQGDFLLVTFATGAPLFLLLTAWSVWYARRRFEADG
jgi:uncharacterized protein DUF3159